MSSGDTITQLHDVFVPERFAPYIVEKSTEVNAFFASGVVESVPNLGFTVDGGQAISMPFYKALGERAQLLDDRNDLIVKKLHTGRDQAIEHRRALVYGATDIASALAGTDPMRVIGDAIAGNWSQEFNRILLASLVGAMGAVSSNTLDISGLSGAAGQFTGESFIDALQTLGDAKNSIVAIATSSLTNASLSKQGLIETIRDADGKVVTTSFMGKTAIEDDVLLPASGAPQVSYLFARGAVGYAEGKPKVPSEVERQALINGGEEYLVSRRHFVLHPRGIAWTPASGVPALQVPSDEELMDSGNWAQAYESKNIRIIKFVHN